MRSIALTAFSMMALAAACSSRSEPQPAEPDAGASGAGGGAPIDAGSDADGGGDDPLGPPIGAAPEPKKLADDAVTVLGVTSDGWVVYRSSQGIVAIPANGSAEAPTLVSTTLGMVHIHASVVFVYSNVNWAKQLGELTIWTAAHGAKLIGPAIYGEDTAFASADGSWVGWIGNVPAPASSGDDGGVDAGDPGDVGADGSDGSDGADGADGGADGEAEAGVETPPPTADLIVATPDLAQQKTLIEALGVGAADTCRAQIGFVEKRLIAAWCALGKSSATLQTFDLPAWKAVTVASNVNPFWAADAKAETLFYTDLSGGAWVTKTTPPGAPTKLDSGVGWGTLLPDGSALLYTVGDQLRRSPLPAIDPTPIVTTGFVSRAGFSPDHALALYSTQVNYDSGVRRNLLLSPTATLNLSPVTLLAEPIAELSRSVFTTNGKWLLYLTADGNEKTLHARSVKSQTTRTYENADTVVAATGSRVIYSANRTGPEVYPTTADLVVMDPGAEGDAVTLRVGTTDGRNFHLAPDGSKLFYAMPPEDETPSALFVQAIP